MEVASRFISGTPGSTRSWTNIGISKFPCAKAEAMWWKLGQVVDRAQLHRLHCRLEAGEGGDDDDAGARLSAEDLRQHLEARVAPQPEVEEDDVEARPLQHLEGAARSGHAQHPPPAPLPPQPH